MEQKLEKRVDLQIKVLEKMETLMSLRIELTEYEMHERQKAIQKNDNMVDESFEFVYE